MLRDAVMLTGACLLCRCMDSGSSNFKIDEQDPEVVLGRGLGRGKGVLIDAGLHNMYVHSIRRAKHFIYIENQFFTGVPPCAVLLSISVNLEFGVQRVSQYPLYL